MCSPTKYERAMSAISFRLVEAVSQPGRRRPSTEMEARLPCSSTSLLEVRLNHSEEWADSIRFIFLRIAERRALMRADSKAGMSGEGAGGDEQAGAEAPRAEGMGSGVGGEGAAGAELLRVKGVAADAEAHFVLFGGPG